MSPLNQGNSGISGFPANYGTVTIDLTSPTTATITFASITTGSNAYLFGDSSSVDLNVNASSFTVGTITGTNSVSSTFTPGPYTNSGSGNVDGFGTFNLTIDDFDGFTHSANMVTFTVTNTSGTWAGATNVLANNSNGDDAAAHIFVCSDPASGCTAMGSSATATGYAGEGAPSTPTPEPGSIALVGVGLIVAGCGRKLLACRNR